MKLSPHIHAESPLTGSTLSALISRAKELNRTHFAYTDHGHLSSALKAYTLAKREGLKLIPGIEIYFKDGTCPIVSGTDVNRCKYFTATLYCQDQEAYQALCKVVSRTDFTTVEIYEEQRQLWCWSDLEQMAKFNVQFVLSGVHCMVGKPMLAGNPGVGEAVLKRLKAIFHDRLSVALLCEPWTKQYASVIEIKLKDGSKAVCLTSDRVTTNKARRIKASDILDKPGHLELKSYYTNNSFHDVNQGIVSAKIHRGFLPLPGGDASLKVNRFLKALASKHGVRVLATDYAYYAKKEDKIVQTMRLEGKNKLQPNLHMKSESEILDYLTKTMSLGPEQAKAIVQETNKWGSNFDQFKLEYQWRLADSGGDPLKQVMEIIKKNGRMKWDAKYVERLREELNVIAKNGKMDMTGYFLPIHDVLAEYKANGRLTGPGRGSAAGSLLAYLMGITQVNPFRYGLSFSRFYSLDRILSNKLADIDSDLEDRELLVGSDGKSGYLFGRWGDRAAQISTRGTLRLKSSILDANRMLNGEVEDWIQSLTKSLPPAPQGVSDKDFIFGFEDEDGNHTPGLLENSEDLKAYTKKKPKEWEMVSKALGISRSFGRHACAFIISNCSINDVIPTKEGYITQYEAKEVEGAGLVKYDFLVVSQLKDIRVCLELINQKNNESNEVGYFTHKGQKLYVWDLPEDGDVYRSVWTGATETCFQINTVTMVPYVKDIMPQNMEDLSLVLSLVRPGPLDFVDENTGRNMAQEYIYRRNGNSYEDIAILNELIPETLSVLCIKKGSSVKTINGSVNIENIKVGQEVQTEDGSYCKVLANYFKGQKETIKVRLDNSEELELTPDHKVLTYRGWVEAGKLTGRDLVKHFWASDAKIDEGTIKDWVVGLVLADGNVCGTTIDICVGNKKHVAEKIKEIVDKEFSINATVYFHHRAYYVRLANKGDTFTVKGSNKITKLFKDLGIYGKNSFTKEFPKKITKKMIEGFIEGDGCVANGLVRIKNKKLAKALFETLQALRIKSSLFLNDQDGVDSVTFDSSKLEFQFKKEIHNNKKGLYFPKYIVDFKKIKGNDKQYFYPKKRALTPFISEYALDKLSKKHDFEVDKSQTWSKVVSVRKGAMSDVYDLSVDRNHSFVVGGNVVHNCYQEQITKIAKELAGFSGQEAELLREAIGKKKASELAKMRPKFIAGSLASGKVDEKEAAELWARIETSGRYSFNKSHGISYSYITYACMFLKHHYPLEWWAAVLTNAEEKEITGKLWPYVKDMVLPPDINLSGDSMVVDYKNEKIRAKLGIIRGMGEASIEPIVANRPYKDIQDFVDKEVAGPALSRKLVHVGVLDSLFPPKLTFLQKLELLEQALENKKYKDKVQQAKLEGRKLTRLAAAKKATLPDEYLNLSPLLDIAMRKRVLPSMPVDIHSVASVHSARKAPSELYPYVFSNNGYKTALISGRHLELVDSRKEVTDKDIYVAATAFVLESSEFSYSGGKKKALKMIVDVDGYVSERVLWPDYESGQLIYPPELKKGAIVTLFFRKRADRTELNVQEVFVEPLTKSVPKEVDNSGVK